VKSFVYVVNPALTAGNTVGPETRRLSENSNFVPAFQQRSDIHISILLSLRITPSAQKVAQTTI
jgi:hypothetical protein